MSTGEWADLDTIMDDADDIWAVMADVMAILYRPIVKIKRWEWRGMMPRRTFKYTIEEYNTKHIEAAESMAEMDMVTANAVAVFFYRIATKFQMITQKSIQEKLAPNMTK